MRAVRMPTMQTLCKLCRLCKLYAAYADYANYANLPVTKSNPICNSAYYDLERISCRMKM